MARLACPRCDASDIMPSMPRGWLETVMLKIFQIQRFRCRVCLRRFPSRRTGKAK